MSNNDEDFQPEAEDTTSDNDTQHGEQTDSEGEGDGSEGETITLTQAELDERLKATRKEQDKRWKERIKKAGGEDGDEESSRKASPKKEVTSDERYDRLELKTEGVKNKDQQDFVLDYAQLKNLSVTDALNSSVVKAELKDMQSTEKESSALPTSSRRTGQTPKDDVQAAAKKFIDKGVRPESEEMRRKMRKYLAGKK